MAIVLPKKKKKKKDYFQLYDQLSIKSIFNFDKQVIIILIKKINFWILDC